MDCQSHLTGVVKELGLMRVQLVGVLRGVQSNIFASHHLMYVRRGSHAVNRQPRRDRTLTLTGFIERRRYPHLSQEVLLRVLVQRRNCTSGPEPGVHRDLILVPLAEAAVVRQADVFLQLRDLTRHQSDKNHTNRAFQSHSQDRRFCCFRARIIK